MNFISLKEGSSKMNPIEKDLYNAALVKDSPCVCGRKSVARLRKYEGMRMYVIGFCPDHIRELSKLVNGVLK